MEEVEEVFERAVDFVLAQEGGYVNDPQDPGGETKYGISKQAYPDLDIQSLTKKEAKEIYRTDYWNKTCEELAARSTALAVSFFDTSVNMGMRSAAVILQRALNRYYKPTPLLLIDGFVGVKTLSTLAIILWGQESYLSKQLLSLRYLTERIDAYTEIKNFNRYGKGWVRRVVDLVNYLDKI